VAINAKELIGSKVRTLLRSKSDEAERIAVGEAPTRPTWVGDRTSTASSSINWWTEVKLCSGPKQLIAEKYK
jgi:hypothetical protein